jgi:hypothetical protein
MPQMYTRPGRYFPGDTCMTPDPYLDSSLRISAGDRTPETRPGDGGGRGGGRAGGELPDERGRDDGEGPAKRDDEYAEEGSVKRKNTERDKEIALQNLSRAMAELSAAADALVDAFLGQSNWHEEMEVVELVEAIGQLIWYERVALRPS